MVDAGARAVKVAIMQPYLLPYIGYWELFAAADMFVVLDDVQFIRRGWVNRNRIRSDRPGRDWAYLTVPVKKVGRGAFISDITMRFDPLWEQDLSRRIGHLYGRDALKSDLAHKLISLPTRPDQALLPALLDLLLEAKRILRLRTPLVLASKIDPNSTAVGQERLIKLVVELDGSEYLNLPGGRGLYDSKAFFEAGVSLQILPETDFRPSARCGQHLSVLDGILSGATDKMREHLADFRI